MKSEVEINFSSTLYEAVDMKRILTAPLFADDTARMLHNDDVVVPRYKKRKQREQTVIKAPAREQPNDEALGFSRMEICLNNVFFFCCSIFVFGSCSNWRTLDSDIFLIYILSNTYNMLYIYSKNLQNL